MNEPAIDPEIARLKLHARLHDPAEKALVLLRDPAGHEGGSVRALRDELLGELGTEESTAVRRADHWASAADRPQFPRSSSDGRYARWSQVRFHEQPVIRHPLSGAAIDLREHGALRETDIDALKEGSIAHFKALVQRDAAGALDPWRTLLAFWRFGPEPQVAGDAAGLGELWRLLPADTRIPDHTIWQHLDLTSAFAGSFRADSRGHCALLTVSLGPVQDFIGAARTTSDLWAGSHLLARLSWEAMRVICRKLGPDAILFPALRGVPQVDLWLLEEGLPPELFDREHWRTAPNSDANPLFSAALPNRFTAIVPAEQAEALAGAVRTHLRDWIDHLGARVVQTLLQEAGLTDDPDTPAYEQMQRQLQGFPEFHWAAVDWQEVAVGADERPDPTRLRDALSAFYGDDHAPGFLGSNAWRVLQDDIEVDDPETGHRAVFYRPNPGVFYPALQELGERVLGGSKATRPFGPAQEQGYRCSLTGESEWLTHDRELLTQPPGARQNSDTLWTRIAERRPAWARKGEHLGGPAALKRLWPSLFCKDLRDSGALEAERVPARFVVSTHTMALVTTLASAVENGLARAPDASLAAEIRNATPAALPRRLARDCRRAEHGDLLARIPGWMDARLEGDSEIDSSAARDQVREVLGRAPETYYALLLMDGDRMGEWLGGGGAVARRYRDAFHPSIEAEVDRRFSGHSAISAYLDTPRAMSPARHLAISGALGDFANLIARKVVEDQHNGRILYAGGDDLMAMLPTGELLAAMQALRHAYSGTSGEDDFSANGYFRLDGRLHLCMGPEASASMGAVIVHHQTPLTTALAELRSAEQRAKTKGQRNAVGLSILKRSGGAIRHTMRWTPPVEDVCEVSTLNAFSDALAREGGGSRRAAYNTANWLADLPEPAVLGGHPGITDYLESVLIYQFKRQGIGESDHASRLARLATVDARGTPLATAREIRDRLLGLTGVAEFLAREVRRPT